MREDERGSECEGRKQRPRAGKRRRRRRRLGEVARAFREVLEFSDLVEGK